MRRHDWKAAGGGANSWRPRFLSRPGPSPRASIPSRIHSLRRMLRSRSRSLARRALRNHGMHGTHSLGKRAPRSLRSPALHTRRSRALHSLALRSLRSLCSRRSRVPRLAGVRWAEGRACRRHRMSPSLRRRFPPRRERRPDAEPYLATGNSRAQLPMCRPPLPKRHQPLPRLIRLPFGLFAWKLFSRAP